MNTVPKHWFKPAFLLFLLLFLSPLLLYAEPLFLEELLQQTGATLRWDPWRHFGLLSKESKTLLFHPGDPWMVLNGTEWRSTGTVLEEEGRLIFSEESVATIMHFFGISTQDWGPYRLSTVLIDPGHGGRDSGARYSWEIDEISYLLQEKDVVLEVSLRLAELLRKKYPDKEITLTRDEDTYPSLEERVAMANNVELAEREGMIYISVHANASLNNQAEGYEVWYLPQDYRRTIIDSASLGGKAIAPIVNTLWEEVFTHESVRLADMILKGFGENLGASIPNRGRREESWFVVRNTRMASVLVELGFLSNKAEAGRLRQPEYLERLSKGLAQGIIDFIRYFESRELLFE